MQFQCRSSASIQTHLLSLLDLFCSATWQSWEPPTVRSAAGLGARLPGHPDLLSGTLGLHHCHVHHLLSRVEVNVFSNHWVAKTRACKTLRSWGSWWCVRKAVGSCCCKRLKPHHSWAIEVILSPWSRSCIKCGGWSNRFGWRYRWCDERVDLLQAWREFLQWSLDPTSWSTVSKCPSPLQSSIYSWSCSEGRRLAWQLRSERKGLGLHRRGRWQVLLQLKRGALCGACCAAKLWDAWNGRRRALNITSDGAMLQRVVRL